VSNEAVLYIYENKDLRRIARDRFPHCWEDIIHDTILNMISRDLCKEDAIKYAVRSIINLSKTTRGIKAKFYKYYDSIEGKDIAEDQEPDIIPSIDKVTTGLHWFHKGVFELFVELGTIKDVSILTSIPQRTISNSVKISQKKIKANWE